MSFNKFRRVVKRRRTKRSYITSKLKNASKSKKRKVPQQKEDRNQDFVAREQHDGGDGIHYYLQNEDDVYGVIDGNISLSHPLDIISTYDILSYEDSSQPIYYNMVRSSGISRSRSTHKASRNIIQQQEHLVILQCMLFLLITIFYCDITQLLPLRLHHYV